MTIVLISLALIQGQGAPPKPNGYDVLPAIKQVATGTMIFCADHKDVYPKGDWKKALMPYVRNANLFNPPGVKKDSYSVFSFNKNLMGVSATTIKEPTRTVLLYLGKNGKLNYAVNGKAAVAFADSSARWITPAEAKKLIWKN